MNYNNKLYEKMSTELENFISEIKSQSPDCIVESAYELVMKEDLLSIFECENFPETEAESLYRLDYPLDTLYQECLKNYLSYMDLLRITIDNRIESAVREMQNKRMKAA